jgi:glutamine synthetase
VDLDDALTHFENSEFVSRAFGVEVHKHLTAFYKNEVNQHENIVTKWELTRYLDLI